jgi:hypothetical protein
MLFSAPTNGLRTSKCGGARDVSKVASVRLRQQGTNFTSRTSRLVLKPPSRSQQPVLGPSPRYQVFSEIATFQHRRYTWLLPHRNPGYQRISPPEDIEPTFAQELRSRPRHPVITSTTNGICGESHSSQPRRSLLKSPSRSSKMAKLRRNCTFPLQLNMPSPKSCPDVSQDRRRVYIRT